jgi:ribonuclease J
MNMTLYGFGGEFVLVDAGQMLGDMLQIPGVVSVVPDVACLAPLVADGRLKGLILTHAHEDHTGALQYVWPQIRVPVYATKFTANMVRKKIFEETGCVVLCTDALWALVRPRHFNGDTSTPCTVC